MMQPANPNLLPVSEADRVRAAPMFRTDWAREEALAGKRDDDDRIQAFAAHRLAAEQARTAAFVAMLEGMKDPAGDERQVGYNRAIDEAIANAKALGEGRVG